MSLIFALLLAVAVLDRPWNIIVVVAAAFLEVIEISLWLRWRKVPSTTGAESIVGARGLAVSSIDPTGQASVRGQLWSVTSPVPIAQGDAVVVTTVEGVRLTVEPVLEDATD